MNLARVVAWLPGALMNKLIATLITLDRIVLESSQRILELRPRLDRLFIPAVRRILPGDALSIKGIYPALNTNPAALCANWLKWLIFGCAGYIAVGISSLSA